MSDVLSDAQMYLSEPDETVLTAALRNKDDIPILMDIVGEDDDEVPVISVSQETHLKNSLAHEEQDVALSDSAETSAEAIADVVEPLEATLKEAFAEESSNGFLGKTSDEHSVVHISEKETSHHTDQSLVALAIQRVLEKRLPDLVTEVLQEIERDKRS